MKRRIIPLLGLIGAWALTLSFAGVAGAADTAMVRVLHASPDAPAVDVYLDDTKVDALTNVPFGTISDYLAVPSGAHNVKVYATGTTTGPVIDADVTVSTGARYTIAATGAVASISAQVLQDKPTPDCSGAQVRVVHFSADAPAVDVATVGTAPADAIVKSLTYPNATGQLALPAGTYDLEVRLAGTTTVALAIPGVAAEACRAYSVFAIGSAATPAVGGNALRAVLAVDATAAAAPAVTAPPTDALAPVAATPADQGIVPALALLAVVGLVTTVAVGRRLAIRTSRSDGR